jgi:HlyD family secretion protein
MRTGVVAALVIGAPVLLIGARLLTQQWALQGPAGGSATIEGDRVQVGSRVGGRLLELMVEEGQEVQQGQLLARLDCAEPEAVLAEARARLLAASAQSRAAFAQAQAAGVGTSSAWVASVAAEAQADALAAQRDAAARQASRVAAQGEGTSQALLDQSTASASALEHQSAAAVAQARAARLQVGLAKGQAAASAESAQAAADQVQAVEAAVRRAEISVDECQVKAPRAGVVEILPFTEGELVPPGVPVAALVDLHQVEATFYLPNAELGAVKVGQEAVLVADAWPDQEFRGKVARVASEAAFTPRNVQTRTDRDRLVYAVEIELDNPERKLRPGMPAQITMVESQ